VCGPATGWNRIIVKETISALANKETVGKKVEKEVGGEQWN